MAEKPKLPWRKWMLGTSAVTCAIGPVFTFACTPSEGGSCAYICDDDPSCVPRYVASDAQTEVPSFGDAVADSSTEAASAMDAAADSVDSATETATDGSSDAVPDGFDAGIE